MMFTTTMIAMVIGLGQAAIISLQPSTSFVNLPTQTPGLVPTAAVDAAAMYTGELTYFYPGLGACGLNDGNADPIVAAPTSIYDASPVCGKSVAITYNGVVATAVIEDRCVGCGDQDLDLSPAVFEKFAPLASGRLYNAQWEII
ncbi:Allergen Asp f 7 [Cytospora mali]|uniref:Allergen Asp f 7 n=1 Tax=Cytospora mali TaxID=578113 RepID=A0A194UUP9_CYTMA|nr:Allergen Asp f 7 [Valsa mali var. pyri (nom. inval.)]